MDTNDNPTPTRIQPVSEEITEQRIDRNRRVWSVDETARILGISRAHAYELIARRELPSLRLGRRIVIPKHALDALLGKDAD